jgi:fumarylacetoacetate (FAA) hydrolase family protein
VLSEVTAILPPDWRSGSFLGRVETPEGPIVVLIREGEVHDVTRSCPTSSLFTDAVTVGDGGADVDTAFTADWSLASPIDLHCVKAAGVTFAVSAIETCRPQPRFDPQSRRESAAASVRSCPAATRRPN